MICSSVCAGQTKSLGVNTHLLQLSLTRQQGDSVRPDGGGGWGGVVVGRGRGRGGEGQQNEVRGAALLQMNYYQVFTASATIQTGDDKSLTQQPLLTLFRWTKGKGGGH